MIFFIITTTLLTTLCAYLGYRVWFLAGAVADLQEQDDDVTTYIQSLEQTNRYMYDKILDAHTKMQDVDLRGAFEAEDEVGTTFEMLKEIIENLKEEFDGPSEEE